METLDQLVKVRILDPQCPIRSAKCGPYLLRRSWGGRRGCGKPGLTSGAAWPRRCLSRLSALGALAWCGGGRLAGGGPGNGVRHLRFASEPDPDSGCVFGASRKRGRPQASEARRWLSLVSAGITSSASGPPLDPGGNRSSKATLRRRHRRATCHWRSHGPIGSQDPRRERSKRAQVHVGSHVAMDKGLAHGADACPVPHVEMERRARPPAARAAWGARGGLSADARGAPLFHDTKITSYPYASLTESFKMLTEKRWMAPGLARHFSKARALCEKRTKHP